MLFTVSFRFMFCNAVSKEVVTEKKVLYKLYFSATRLGNSFILLFRYFWSQGVRIYKFTSQCKLFRKGNDRHSSNKRSCRFGQSSGKKEPVITHRDFTLFAGFKRESAHALTNITSRTVDLFDVLNLKCLLFLIW